MGVVVKTEWEHSGKKTTTDNKPFTHNPQKGLKKGGARGKVDKTDPRAWRAWKTVQGKPCDTTDSVSKKAPGIKTPHKPNSSEIQPHGQPLSKCLPYGSGMNKPQWPEWMIFADEVRKKVDDMKPTKSGKRERDRLYSGWQEACSRHGYRGSIHDWHALIRRLGRVPR